MAINYHNPFTSDCSDDEDNQSEVDDMDVYSATVWVFANISGMITLLPDGTIHSINHNFALMLFGFSEEDLIGKVRSMYY